MDSLLWAYFLGGLVGAVIGVLTAPVVVPALERRVVSVAGFVRRLGAPSRKRWH